MDDGYFGSGKLITASIKKHGLARHSKEVLEQLPSREALKLREKELVNEELLGNKLCMNLKLGGEGGQSSSVVKKMWDVPGRREKQSAAVKKCWERDDYREKIASKSSVSMTAKHSAGKIKYDTFTGRKHSDETLEKMRVSHVGLQVGEKNSQFGTCWITNGVDSIKINKDELEEFVSKGFRQGRKIKPRPRSRSDGEL